MFPNDLWQAHFLTRPTLGKILIIPRGMGEKLPDVQLDNLAGGMAAAMLSCAGGVLASMSHRGLSMPLSMPGGPCDSNLHSPGEREPLPMEDTSHPCIFQRSTS